MVSDWPIRDSIGQPKISSVAGLAKRMIEWSSIETIASALVSVTMRWRVSPSRASSIAFF